MKPDPSGDLPPTDSIHDHPGFANYSDNQYSDITESEDNSNEYWVTVFGFPSDLQSSVLREFSSSMNVKRYSKPHGNVNYMHLCFESKMEYEAALQKNGCDIHQGLMIGVKEMDNQYFVGNNIVF